MRFLILAVMAFILMGADLSPRNLSVIPAAQAETKDEFEYFEMSPIMVPVINGMGLSQQVSMIVSIEVPKGRLDEVSAYGPRLTDAYIQDMYGVLSAGYGLVHGNVLDIPAIKQRLSGVTVRVLGDDVVHDVLLQVVQQRPL